MYKETFERVTHYFTSERYMGELKAAKDEFFQRTGTVFEDEPTYESRMTAFLEWFLLERVLWDSGAPPVRLFSEMYGETCSEREQTYLRGLQRTCHSLFEYASRLSEGCRVRDLFDGKLYEVTERRSYAGIQKADVLDARLVPVGEHFLFSDAMWIHPTDVRSFIMGEVKKRQGRDRSGFNELLFDLAYMKLKSDRFRHLPVASVYEATLKERARGEG